MSVKKSLSFNDGNASYNLKNQKSSKRRRFDRCFSSVELVSMEQGKKLKEMDSNKLKSEIKRWAKAVVAYARQSSVRKVCILENLCIREQEK
ncbi:hypothetical protein P8452_68653 [Trifolium repens]|nr:hypothetical protein P8452_68653 [Trifolium repens]